MFGQRRMLSLHSGFPTRIPKQHDHISHREISVVETMCSWPDWELTVHVHAFRSQSFIQTLIEENSFGRLYKEAGWYFGILLLVTQNGHQCNHNQAVQAMSMYRVTLQWVLLWEKKQTINVHFYIHSNLYFLHLWSYGNGKCIQ